MPYSQNKFYKNNNGGLFSFFKIIPHIIFILIALGCYYYFILVQELFPLWSDWLYYGLKGFIALEVILASGRSMLAPIFTLLAGAIVWLGVQYDYFGLVTTADAWQLITLAIIGFVITVIVKF